jgi:hypothetical protein
MRLHLVGDDEALDVLADLSRHLDYFEVSRTDDPPERALGREDHVVLGFVDATRAAALLPRMSAAAFAIVLPPAAGAAQTAGARAIVVAAQLVAAL